MDSDKQNPHAYFPEFIQGSAEMENRKSKITLVEGVCIYGSSCDI
jgi:hypothetical protein